MSAVRFKNKDKVNTEPLDMLKKVLKDNRKKVRVGVLASNTNRSSGGVTNPMIGHIHEYGSATIPQRSFLRIPLADKLNGELKKSKLFTPKVFKEVQDGKDLTPWLEKIGQIAVNVVLDAFASAGFGKWPAWKNPKYKNNANQILVDTQQLRDSISYEVK